METIICKNCGIVSYNDYYDFCSVWCFVDFAHKHYIVNLSQLKSMAVKSRYSVLEEENKKLDEEIAVLEEEKEELKASIDELEGDVEIGKDENYKHIQHLESLQENICNYLKEYRS